METLLEGYEHVKTPHTIEDYPDFDFKTERNGFIYINRKINRNKINAVTPTFI